MDIKITLEAARINRGLTQKEVAERLNVTQQTLSAWEKGLREPKISQARKLAKLYDVPLDNIFFCRSNPIMI